MRGKGGRGAYRDHEDDADDEALEDGLGVVEQVAVDVAERDDGGRRGAQQRGRRVRHRRPIHRGTPTTGTPQRARGATRDAAAAPVPLSLARGVRPGFGRGSGQGGFLGVRAREGGRRKGFLFPENEKKRRKKGVNSASPGANGIGLRVASID